MASILVKAYVRQLFGSPEIHVFEFDTQGASIEELRSRVSELVDGRAVTLTWLDADGDEIRLSSDEHLSFAVKHGVKDNVLRVSVRVDWLGMTASQRHRLQQQQEEQAAAAALAAANNDEDAMGVDGDEAPAASGDGQEGNPEGEAATASSDAGSGEGDSARSTGAEKTATPGVSGKERKSRRGRHGNSCYSGFVRTVGADGVARERDLTEEEAAYLLRHTSNPFESFNRSPLSLADSLFSTPQLQYRRQPVNAPLFLCW